MKYSCPICSSSDFQLSEENKVFCTSVEIKFTALQRLFFCHSCGMEGDFSNENDSFFEKARQSAISRFVLKLMQSLAEMGYSDAEVERALKLKARTVSKWRLGECSATDMALIIIIKKFPFLIEASSKEF